MQIPNKVPLNFMKTVKFPYPVKMHVPDKDPSVPVKNAHPEKVPFPDKVQFSMKFTKSVKFS